MPRGGACNHRRCYGGECRMLSAEEIEPDADDFRLAKRLVEEGWRSVSTNKRRVARWLRPAPPLLEIVDPAWRDHPAVINAAKSFDYHASAWALRHTEGDSPDFEKRELTIRQWQAFKRAGGLIA